MKTDHYAQSFKRLKGKLVGAPPLPCRSAEHAIMRAEKMGQGKDRGAVAIAVTGEPEFGEFEPPVVLARYGEVPQDLA